MILLLIAVVIAAAVYQALALVAAIARLRPPAPASENLPPISILKPVKGLDPHFYDAIRSCATQDYPDFEMLFGVADPADPAVPVIKRLKAEFPGRRIEIVHCTSQAPNAKVASLIDLARQARYAVLLVSDSDIRVPAGYLRRVVTPLEDPKVGVVTCLYGARADQWPGRWEAIGISTDFAPSVLVAPLVGVREFGLGSTLVFRREQLQAIGGFEALADYVADDYQLACRIHRLGFRVVLSDVVVETHLSGRSWKEVWRHQLRWARTIRVSRGGFWGYLGLPVTQASLWALVAALLGLWEAVSFLLALRLAVGIATGAGVLRSRDVLYYFWLIPLRDLWGFAVWLNGLFGDEVTWRGSRFKLSADGRISPLEPQHD
ncbi:MAG: bacteriohopanetetrol glucosamine biosynthesis glycosyltransferase HpnI [Bryobacteraceae bacterium]